LLALCSGAVACKHTPSPPIPAPSPAEYRVGPPDTLSISVLPEPAITSTVVVRPDGMISVDLIGDIPATGRTVSEIARDIEERVSRFKRDARATVSVVSAMSATVTVLGEVNSNGNFALTRDTRIIEAIGLQGGFTIYASRSRAKLIRTDGTTTLVIPVNLNAIADGDLRTNFLLQEGDLLIVPPTWLAQIGYWFQQILFPFQPAMAIGTTLAAFGN
jgi:polysaccharide export outer membrane protein